MTPEETLDWLAQQHFDQCREERPIQDWIRKMKSQLPEQPEQEPRTAEEKLVRMKSELAYMRKSQPAVAEQHKQEPVAWEYKALYIPNPQFDDGMRVTRDLRVAQVNGEPNTIKPLLYTTPPQRKPLDFGDFFEWANDQGYDTAHTHDGVKWICLNPMTDDLWKAWQASYLGQLTHYESGMTADELWLSNGKLRAELADLKVQRKPLTDEQLRAVWEPLQDALCLDYKVFARAIEAAHGIHPTGFKE